jgi:hypothetical protein
MCIHLIVFVYIIELYQPGKEPKMITENINQKFISILVDVMAELEIDAQVSDKIYLLHHVLGDFAEYYETPADPEIYEDCEAIYEALYTYLDN